MSKIINIILTTLLTILLLTIQVFAQPYNVSGRVTDHASGNALNNVSVKIGMLSATTDINGDYTISGVTGGQHIASASLVNYAIDDLVVNVNGNLTGRNIVAYPGKIIPIIPLKARKDTTMLCLNGCKRSGSNSWNQSRELAAGLGIHDNDYCVPTAISMLNRFYGGTLTRDEIMFHSNQLRYPDYEEQVGTRYFAGELSHSEGLPITSYFTTLLWALNHPQGMEALSNQPSELEYKSYINDERPFFWGCSWGGFTGHAMVVAGYRYWNETFQLLFLNTNNNGAVGWVGKNADGTWAFASPGTWASTIIPPKNSVGRNYDIRIGQDTDGDGVNNFDEIVRWDAGPIYQQDLKEDNPDTDSDNLSDGKDIEGWLFRGQNDPIGKGKSDDDGDGIRGELDSDSDNGGVMDGDEDVNHDANKLNDETDPYGLVKPNADDIPKVKITLSPIKQADNKKYVKGNTTATFVFYRKDGVTFLPVFDKTAGPLIAKFTSVGGAAVTIVLTPTGALPTATWTATLPINATTPAAKAEFSVKNGSTDVEIIEGKDFYIDPASGAATVK